MYAIDTEGKIYTWGYNRYGQLGDGTKENRSTPICISEKNKIVKIINNLENEEGVIFITDKEKIYCFLFMPPN